MGRETKVIAAALAIFAVFLPVALWVGKDFAPAPRPRGAVVIQLLKIEAAGEAYRAEPFALTSRTDVILYEGLQPLGPVNFVTDADSRKFVVFSASDNSDPRSNGRLYWLVLP